MTQDASLFMVEYSALFDFGGPEGKKYHRKEYVTTDTRDIDEIEARIKKAETCQCKSVEIHKAEYLGETAMLIKDRTYL